MYVTVICIQRDNGERSICVEDWPISELLGTNLEQAFHEARKNCRIDECDLEIRITAKMVT